jgi:hypothetical protein
VWKERAVFPKTETQDKTSSQPMPPQIMIPDAPKTARDIEAFR